MALAAEVGPLRTLAVTASRRSLEMEPSAIDLVVKHHSFRPAELAGDQLYRSPE